MRKAKITIPAVCTNLGPGVNSLALALGMHLTVNFVERSDTHLLIETIGEDSADLSPDCYHPVMYAAVRVFQQLEDSPLGLRVVVQNPIPMGVGLGAEEAMTVAGLVGANSLMGTPLDRDDLIALGADILGRADGIIGAMVGGLTICMPGQPPRIHRRVEVSPLKVLVVLPEIENYDSEQIPLPATVPMDAALQNIGRGMLLVEAFRRNDYRLLGQILLDHLAEPALSRHIPGYHEVIEAARQTGALGATVCGGGPAMLVFALFNHYKIADAVQSIFDRQGILSRVWTLQVDTQGVVVTAAESTPD